MEDEVARLVSLPEAEVTPESCTSLGALQWALKKHEKAWMWRGSKTPIELSKLIVEMRSDALKLGFKPPPDNTRDGCNPLMDDHFDIWTCLDSYIDMIGLDEETMRKRQQELGFQ